MTISANMRTDIKQEERVRVVEFTKQNGVIPKRIITLPSREGWCAILFRKTWPQSTIIGIERSQLIARKDTLVQPVPNALHPMNQLYCISVEEMLQGMVPQQQLIVPAKNRSGGTIQTLVSSDPELASAQTKINDSFQPSFDYGRYDLAFLDFCGSWKERVDSVQEACAKLLNLNENGAVMATTFQMKNRTDAVQPADVMKQLLNFGPDVGFKVSQHLFWPYVNRGSHMCLFALFIQTL